jgi:hypothetical protein
MASASGRQATNARCRSPSLPRTSPSPPRASNWVSVHAPSLLPWAVGFSEWEFSAAKALLNRLMANVTAHD